MTLNRQTFRTRTLTAIVFAVVMLAGLLWNHWSFFILFSIIHFGCWIEYQKLVELIDPGYKERTPFHKYGVMIAGWCLMLWFCSAEYSILGFRLHELGFWMGLLFAFVLPISELLFTSNIRLKNIGHSVFGLVYISLSLGLMINLFDVTFSRTIIEGPNVMSVSSTEIIPILIVFTIWINDTMAYIIGSLIGRNPLTSISPKKTWEGTVGGVVLATGVIAGLIFYAFKFSDSANWYHWIILPFIAAVAGVLGDLLESKLKRLANVKDSGHLLPGHGGFLDRFDSMLVAIPFVWLYVELVMK